MKKVLIALTSLAIITSAFVFIIVFGGKLDDVRKAFHKWSLSSEFLPFSPYKTLKVPANLVHFKNANKINFIDQALFWKGSGAIAQPILSNSNKLVRSIIINEGNGYSNFVKAIVTGPNNHLFELGNPDIHEGSIKSLNIRKSSIWHDSITYFSKETNLPFSGTIEKRYIGGQILERMPILNGKTHGTLIKFNREGIPIYNKDYKNGRKHGTHIYWFDQPVDPEDFIPFKNEKHEIIHSLWRAIKEESKSKFGSNFNSDEANAWVIHQYKMRGGSLQVNKLEHWKDNLKHGLFEGYDQIGNKTFKDEYNYGLRTKHKIYDVTKKN